MRFMTTFVLFGSEAKSAGFILIGIATVPKLKKHITFVNETFENNSGDSPNFTRLATSEDIFVYLRRLFFMFYTQPLYR
ncbi:hypothetical protein F4803DRAFT_524433 [Xylaria telfairii]|nr:hypothetical protein F4803DRAFT_524433 [Xylaria telfairii]